MKIDKIDRAELNLSPVIKHWAESNCTPKARRELEKRIAEIFHEVRKEYS